jgi:hypothetical protein
MNKCRVQARVWADIDLPVGHVTQNPVKQKILLLRKYCHSVFRKIMALIRPSCLDKRGERVVTIVRQDAMDAMMPRDERHQRVRQSRVVLAPLGWCQVC